MNGTDWHSADIIAALKKSGITLAELSRRSGYAPSTLANTLVRPWTRGEQLIAAALNLQPEQIWASRYHNKVRKIRDKKEKLPASTEQNKSIPFQP